MTNKNDGKRSSTRATASPQPRRGAEKYKLERSGAVKRRRFLSDVRDAVVIQACDLCSKGVLYEHPVSSTNY